MLNGGEVAVSVMLEAITRLLPGFMGNAEKKMRKTNGRQVFCISDMFFSDMMRANRNRETYTASGIATRYRLLCLKKTFKDIRRMNLEPVKDKILHEHNRGRTFPHWTREACFCCSTPSYAARSSRSGSTWQA